MNARELKIMDKIRLKSIDEYIEALDRAILSFSAAIFTFKDTDKYEICLTYLNFYLNSRADYLVEISEINERLGLI